MIYHHGMPIAHIPLTLYRHPSLSFIALGLSSAQCLHIPDECEFFAGQPSLVCPCGGHYLWVYVIPLYRNTKVKVRSPDGDTEYFDIVAGVLQGYMLAPYLFIICLDYVLRTSIDKIRENGFELTKKRSKRYPAKTITDADYVDDLALLANTPNQAETLLHSLERAAAGIGLHVNAHKTEYVLQPNGQHYHTRRSLSETSRQIHLPRK